MAFTGTFLTTAFKQALLEGVHDFRAVGGHIFKLALYDASANLSATTPAYTSAHEVPNSGSYVAGGGTLVSLGPSTSGTVGLVSFAPLSFTSATITARGALIYNSTPAHGPANPSVMVLDFGADRVSFSGTFTVQFPVPDTERAIIRVR
jgi:hypothetical protein